MDEVVKSLSVLLKLHQQIHVTRCPLLFTHKGTEQAKSLHSQGSDPILVLYNE